MFQRFSEVGNSETGEGFSSNGNGFKIFIFSFLSFVAICPVHLETNFVIAANITLYKLSTLSRLMIVIGSIRKLFNLYQ